MKFNPEQERAIKSPTQKILVLAVPGSGKTTCLVNRAIRILDEGASPREILTITFTRKAAGMIRARLAETIPEEDLAKMDIGTSHSFCAKVVREYAEYIGYRKNYSIYDEQDRLDILSNIQSDYGWKISTKKYLKKIALGQYDQFSDDERRVWKEYTHRLKRYNAVDYEMLLILAVKILKEVPLALERYTSRYRYIFYDEFHDIAKLEDEIMLTLAIENSFVVADYSQSIYAFRGCSNKYVVAYKERHHQCELIKLPKNYRSTPAICKAAENLINRNLQPFGYYEIQAARESTLEDKDIEVVPGLLNEAGYISTRIKQSLNIGAIKKDWCVLVRTNHELKRIASELEETGIRIQVVRRGDYYLLPEIKNMIAYFRLMSNPRDEYSLSKLIRLPAYELEPAEYRAIRKKAMELRTNLFQACKVFPKTEKLVAQILEAPVAPLSAVIQFYLSNSRYFGSILEQGLYTKVESIKAIAGKIEDYLKEEQARNTLEAFLESISLESALDQWDEELDAVNIMTIHLSKGLEFTNVIIAGLEEGNLPLKNQDREEERRLMFVAVTRAKDQLILTRQRERRRYGKGRATMESSFVKELFNESNR